jgi:hypothetical protein
MVLTPSHPVPIHDHPEGAGIQMVVRGRLAVQHYERGRAHRSSAKLASLRKVDDAVLGPGAWGWIDPVERNLHGLHAISPRCTVLDVIVSPAGAEQRRVWYFPLPAANNPMNECCALSVPEGIFATTRRRIRDGYKAERAPWK